MLESAFLHWRMDTAQSFGISFGFFIGLLLQKGGYSGITPYVDPVMAIILALVFITTPVKSVLRNILELLDAVPGGNFYARIKKILETRKPEYLAVQKIRARKAGEKIFLDIIFTADSNLTIARSEELADKIKKDVNSDLGNCDVVISFKPKSPAE
jgi:divalent metal cation (Fe/Co/Zn/Cd) transporter